MFHAGLHKSGTTTIQSALLRGFGAQSRIWYPASYPEFGGNHAPLVWPILDAFRGRQQHIDLEFYRILEADGPDLAEIMSQAESMGVDRLIISTEELDRLQPGDVRALAGICDPSVTTVLFTVTRPIHRWSACWQELVRAGLGQLPREAEHHILSLASLAPRRLEGLIDMFPAARKVVRLVRTDPYEADLVSSVLSLVGFGDANQAANEVDPVKNVSLGEATELLRMTNSAGITTGFLTEENRATFYRILEESVRVPASAEVARSMAPPSSILEAATQELNFLTDPPVAGVEIHDPANQIDRWLDLEPPEWYRRLSLEGWSPFDDRDAVPEDVAWALRLQRAALERNLAYAQVRETQLRRRLTIVETALSEVSSPQQP